MGTITRTFTNNIGASGVLGSGAINNASLNSITTISGVSLKLLSTATASGDSSISFTSGIDSTYDEYWFVFNNIHPASDNVNFVFQGSTDGGSNYNTTMTTTYFRAYHSESGASSALEYADHDLAQGTSYQELFVAIGSDNDQACCGILKLFNPSSTTYVKHFVSQGASSHPSDIAKHNFAAGYFNTTSAINAINFKFFSGGDYNIDAGTIKLYGVS